jgi:hypothetical protein
LAGTRSRLASLMFGINGFGAACDYLELTPDERVRARKTLRDLESQLGLTQAAD